VIGKRASPRRILVIDVGGTHVKLLASGRRQPRKFDSGPQMTAPKMVEQIKKLTTDWKYDAVSLGYPGLVVHGHIASEPRNLAAGWVGFDFKRAFKKPVKIINDAAMQALGDYRGGRILFVGLGTGMGSAMIVDGDLEPMELGHLPYQKGRSYEDYAGARGLLRLGKKKWNNHVFEIIGLLRAALEPDRVIIGGGNAKLLKRLPGGVTIGDNAKAFAGGFRLWKS
jgi:polyphosphate glucokinase